MTRTKRKRRKNRTGISLILWLAANLPLAAAAEKKAPESYALVAGTVFQESGYALPGADVTLVPDPLPGAPSAKGAKKMHALSNARGEFIFRVAAGPARFKMSAAAKGFQTQEKSVQIQSDERVDVTFQLPSQSK